MEQDWLVGDKARKSPAIKCCISGDRNVRNARIVEFVKDEKIIGGGDIPRRYFSFFPFCHRVC